VVTIKVSVGVEVEVLRVYSVFIDVIIAVVIQPVTKFIGSWVHIGIAIITILIGIVSVFVRIHFRWNLIIPIPIASRQE